MRINAVLLAVVIGCGGCSQRHPVQTRDVNPRPSEEEVLLAKALALRARGLEKDLAIQFSPCWTPKVTLEPILSNPILGSLAGEYYAENQVIKFPRSLVTKITAQVQVPLWQLDPASLAKNPYFGEIADHELGHLYMDQLSRRTRQLPWYTVEQFRALGRDEQLGLNILSEGVGMFFQRTHYAEESYLVSVQAFPTDATRWFHPYEMVAYHGGFWLVRDILDKRVERGLTWLVTHPFVAKEDNLRQAAIDYRKRALADLTKRQVSSRPN